MNNENRNISFVVALVSTCSVGNGISAINSNYYEICDTVTNATCFEGFFFALLRFDHSVFGPLFE